MSLFHDCAGFRSSNSTSPIPCKWSVKSKQTYRPRHKSFNPPRNIPNKSWNLSNGPIFIHLHLFSRIFKNSFLVNFSHGTLTGLINDSLALLALMLFLGGPHMPSINDCFCNYCEQCFPCFFFILFLILSRHLSQASVHVLLSMNQHNLLSKASLPALCFCR